MPYPVLQTFDAPNGDFACVRRARSNTPLQALTTLNEPIFVECARALALRDARRRAARPTPTGSPTPSAAASAGRRRDGETASPARAARASRRQRFADGWVEPVGAGRRHDPTKPPTLPAGRDAGAARRLDRRRPRAAEPRRDDHQGMTRWIAMDREHLPRHATATQVTRRWFFQECGVGLGRDRARLAARRARPARRDRALGRSARARSRRTSRRRPSASSTCSWPARRATSNCSTTSRSWRSSTASCRRPSCSKGYRAAFINPNSTLLGPEVQVRQARPVRRRAVRAAAAPGRGRRRHRDRQVDGRPTRSTTRPARSS